MTPLNMVSERHHIQRSLVSVSERQDSLVNAIKPTTDAELSLSES